MLPRYYEFFNPRRVPFADALGRVKMEGLLL